jgi:hypothetical protein
VSCHHAQQHHHTLTHKVVPRLRQPQPASSTAVQVGFELGQQLLRERLAVSLNQRNTCAG